MSWDDLRRAGYDISNEEHVYAIDEGTAPQPPSEYFIVRAYIRGQESGVVLEARHPTQMLDLRIICEGYSWKPSRPRVLHRDKGKSAGLVFEFPPQHLAEKILGTAAVPQPGAVAARLSAKTRLVFRVPHDKNLKLRLSREPYCLLDWENLEPQIHPRAKAAIGTDVTTQLEAAFGNPPYDKYDFKEARKAIQDQFADPGPQITTLEIAGRLLLSPNEEAGWVLDEPSVAIPGEKSTTYPLWSATLDQVGRRSVRALWSRRFKNQSIPNIELPTDDAPGPHDKGLLSVSPRAHWEIVGQTSLYGLPAMRRLEINAAGDPEDMPNGSVIRPVVSLPFLDVPFGKVDAKDAGIAIAKPFGQADIQLTSLGATVFAEWKGEPARLLPLSPDDPPPVDHPWLGYSLERLQIKSWLGRDVQIVELYKGFLYPLGTRAAYAVVRERRIKVVDGAPTSYVVQRQFIMTQGQPRQYPGPYHSHEARDFPCGTVRMKTLMTPDLIDPILSPGLGQESGTVDQFWPRFGKDGATHDVRFEWLTDDGVLVVSRLFFVSNNTVGIPSRLEKLEAAYNADSNVLAIAELGGARKRYAELGSPSKTFKAQASEASPVDTSFDTHTWRLGVRPKNAPNPYTMDARMEGADQPPFYPYVRHADIGIQSLDRLLGLSHGRYTVCFDEDYCREGFSGSDKTAREIFLRLQAPLPMLESQKQGQSTGALVHQQVNIDAISRKIGLVGGASKPSRRAAQPTRAPSYDPSTFFSEVKLFGAISLKELITTFDFEKDAPKLVESASQGARLLAEEKATEAIPRIQAAARAAHIRVYSHGGLRDQLKDWMAKKVVGSITVRELYGALCTKLDALLAPDALERCLTELQTAADLGAVARQAGILSKLRPVVLELERLIHDPVPDLLDEALRHLLELKALIADATQSGEAVLKQVFRDAASKWLQMAFCNLPDAFIRNLFGTVRSCDELGDPIAALADVHQAMLRHVLGYQLQCALDMVLLASGALDERLTALSGAVARMVRESHVAEAVAIVSPFLSAPDPNQPDDIRKLAQQQILLREIAEATSRPFLRAMEHVGSIASALQALRTLRADFAGLYAAELRPIFERLRTLLPTPDPETTEQAHRLLVTALESRLHALVVAQVHTLLDETIRIFEGLEELEARLADVPRLLWNALLEAVLECLERSRIGMLLARLCDELNDAANGITHKLSGGFAVVTPVLDAMAVKALQLATPGCTPEQLRSLRGLAGEAAGLSKYLQAFAVAPVLDVCNAPDVALQEVERYQALRKESAAAVRRMALRLKELETDFAVEAKAWAVECGQMALTLLGLASWDAFQQAELDVLITRIRQQGQDFEGLARDLQARREQLNAAVASVKTILTNPGITPTALLNAQVLVDQILEKLDARLVAGVMQVVAFSGSVVGDLEAKAANFLRWLASQQINGQNAIQLPHSILIVMFDGLARTFSDAKLAVILDAMTGLSPAGFTAQSTALSNERRKIGELAGDDAVCVKAANELWTASKSNSLALSGAVKFIRGIKIGDLAQHVTNAAEALLLRVLEEARALADTFVPTKVITRYEWKVNLQGNKLLSFTNPADQPQLELGTTITFDPLAPQATEVETSGHLKPFGLKLIDGWHMATLRLDGADFGMKAGQKPTLNMRVVSVELGPNLEYLALLQSYLSGSSDGFYYRPTTDGGKLGVEAGYVFDAGLVQIGTVQFINVTFGVGMRLFFDSSPAQFFFKLADPERPFLIACPPYGGGGWLTVTSEGDNVTGLDLSFVFGGVAELRFAVLRLHARVLAGVGVRLQMEGTKKQWRIRAIFEAVGEGNIACFSVSVFIRITLEQIDGGDLWGHAVYGFSFRVGFVKIGFRVTASYRLAGKKSGAPALALAADGPTVVSVIEDKQSEWNSYRENFSMDLL